MRVVLPHFSVLSLVLFVSLLAVACTTPSVKAQVKEVPPAVATEMLKQYPEATDIKWNRDRNNSYEAHFKLDGEKFRADFTPEGRWIETEESVKWKEMPKAVRDAVKEEYDKDDIVELEHTVNAEKGEFYDVEIDPKGKKKFDVEYRKTGEKL